MACNSTANILILCAIIFVVVADSDSRDKIKRTDASKSRTRAILNRVSRHVCPPFGTSKFEVQTLQTTTPMFGCAYMHKLLTNAPVFHLHLERPEKTSVHGNCNNTKNMDHTVFECLSIYRPANEDEFKKGWQYMSLVDHTVVSETKTRSYRCALYVVDDQDNTMVRSIHMVISKPIKGKKFKVRLCNGLSDLMARDKTRPKIPEGYRYLHDGSLFIYLLGRKTSIIINNTTGRPTTTTTTTKRPTTTTTTTRRPTTTTTTTSRPTTTTTTTRRPTTTTTTTTTKILSEVDSFRDNYFLYIVGIPENIF